MSSTSSPSIVKDANDLNLIAMMFIRCFCYIFIPLGTIGHLMSIYVFTRPTLRSNPCGRYFLAATIVGLLHTIYVLPMRMIQLALINTNPGAYSHIFCKLVWFSLNSLRGLGYWMIVFACADRYLCSHASVGMRSWSSIRVANRVIPLVTILGFLAYIHVPIFFTSEINPTTQKPICYRPDASGIYRIILSYFHLIYFGLSPSICMLLFGILTFRNIEKSKQNAVGSSRSSANQITRKTNRQMFRMLLVQVLIYCTTGLTFSVAIIITSINAYRTKTVFQIAQENMLNAVIGMLATLGPCVSFYLFTLSSSLFRKELKNFFNRLTCHYTQVQPIETRRMIR